MPRPFTEWNDLTVNCALCGVKMPLATELKERLNQKFDGDFVDFYDAMCPWCESQSYEALQKANETMPETLFTLGVNPIPCPFCGAPDPLIRSEDNDHWCYRCLKCDTWGPVGSDKAEALEKWNTRKEVAHAG